MDIRLSKRIKRIRRSKKIQNKGCLGLNKPGRKLSKKLTKTMRIYAIKKMKQYRNMKLSRKAINEKIDNNKYLTFCLSSLKL